MLDVAITGGDLVDGTGAPRRPADVGVRDGRVVALGRLGEAARRTIDAAGRIVAPGFVDVHTHLDVQIFWDPTLSPSPLHGVTTVIGGNCGFSVAPLVEREAEFLMRMLARVEGMPLESLEAGVPWDWHSTAEYLDRIEGLPAINAGFMVGHSALRRVVMGEEGSLRAATPDELAEMARLLREGLAAGALGFASTWSNTHNDADGHPVPSRHATVDELVALASVCGELPGTSLEFLPQARGRFGAEVVDAMTRMSAAARRPLNWNVLNIWADTLDECRSRLSASDDAKAAGGKVVGLAMPLDLQGYLTFRTGFLLDTLPDWELAMALPRDEKLRVLRDPVERRRLAGRAAQSGQVTANWSDKVIVETFTPDTKRYQGRRVSDIAAEECKDPFDALVDIVCADGLRTTFRHDRPPAGPDDWAARQEIVRDPRVVVGASDAGAHVDFIGNFNYTTRLLGDAVRDRQVFGLEELVSQFTDVPARLYGLRDRGRLAEGAYADVVVFDEMSVGSEPLEMRFDLPAGAGRLTADAVGVDHVLVNGEVVVSSGRFTDARPGTVLRSGRDTDTPSMS